MRHVQVANLDVDLREGLVESLSEVLGDVRDLSPKLGDIRSVLVNQGQRAVREVALRLFQLVNAVSHCVPLTVELAHKLLHVGLQIRLVIWALEHDARLRRWTVRQVCRARKPCSQ